MPTTTKPSLTLEPSGTGIPGRRRVTSWSSSHSNGSLSDYYDGSNTSMTPLPSPLSTDNSYYSNNLNRQKTTSFFNSNPISKSSPPPNPSSSPIPTPSSTTFHLQSPRKSWLDKHPTPHTPPPPILPRTTSDSPTSSPTLSTTEVHKLVPPLSLNSSPAVAEAAKVQSSPSTSSPTVSLKARFLNFGPPSRFGTIDVIPSPSATPSTSSKSSIPIPKHPQDGNRSHDEEDDDEPIPHKGDEIGQDYVVEKVLGKGSFSRVVLGRRKKRKLKDGKEDDADEGVVALKLITRKSYTGNERMKISVLREVEVLKVAARSVSLSILSSLTIFSPLPL